MASTHTMHVRKQLLRKPTMRKNTPNVRGGTSQETEEETRGGSQTRLGADISMADLLTPKNSGGLMERENVVTSGKATASSAGDD